MSRGTVKAIGDHFTNQNGYTYEKRESGWVPIHIVIAEKNLDRKLESNERAFYIDNNRMNHDPKNIGVKIVYSKQSPQARLISLDAEIQDLKDKLEDLLVRRKAIIAELATPKV